MNSALKKINAEVKRIKKKHPGRSHKAAQKEAGRLYRAGKLGKCRKKTGIRKLKRKGHPRRMGGVKTISKSHVDRNRFKNVDIQIGSAVRHISAAKKILATDIGKLEYRKFAANTKTAKKKIAKRIREKKSQYNRLR